MPVGYNNLPPDASAPCACDLLDADGKDSVKLTVEGWTRSYDNDGRETLVRSFVFATFALAIDWMGALVETIDAADHHPEWSNVYNRVTVVLTTHDVTGGPGADFNEVTERDLLLAGTMNDLYNSIA